MAIIYRPASSADVGAIQQIGSAAFECEWSRADAERQLWAQTRVIEADGEICGMITFGDTGDGVHITTVAVAPEHQGKGYGHLMLSNALEELAREPHVTIEARFKNPRLVQLYSSFGFFIESGRTFSYFMRLRR